MLFKAYNQLIESDFDMNLPTGNGESTIVFRENNIPDYTFVKTKMQRKGINASISVNKDNLGLLWEDVAIFEAIDGSLINYQKFTHENDVFRLFALGEVLGLALFQKGFFLLHGSAVIIDGKATVFIGVPGAGKSTTIAAFAKHGHTVLSDDLTAIAFDSHGNPLALPGIPHIKIWESSVVNLGYDKTALEPAFEGHNKYLITQNLKEFPQEGIPLEQICVLERPYSKKKSALSFNEKIICLLEHFPLPDQILSQEDLIKHFEQSAQLIAKVKMRRFKRPRDFNMLENFVKSLN